MNRTRKSLKYSLEEAQTLSINGHEKKAIKLALDLCKKFPNATSPRKLLAKMAENPSVVPVTPRFSRELARCITEHYGYTRALAKTANYVLNANKKFIGLIIAIIDEKIELNECISKTSELNPIIEDELFISMLETTLIPSNLIERAIIKIRKQFLIAIYDNSFNYTLDKKVLRLLSAIAKQSWINEYVYYSENDEHEKITKLGIMLENELIKSRNIDARLEIKLLIYALYQPLNRLKVDRKCWEVTWPPSLKPIIKEVNNYYIEKIIKNDIKSFDIHDQVSKTVQDQYESNPYPRWAGISDYNRCSYGQYLKLQFPWFNPPDYLFEPVRMLIAGCGTGQEAVASQACYELKELLAIDLSKSSIAYAIRRTRELGLENKINYRQADILQLQNLTETPEFSLKFDVIASNGVLHHMKNPSEGWKNLIKLLRPNGLMIVSLYSSLARQSITSARRYIKDMGIKTTPEGIRSFRKDIFDCKYPWLGNFINDPDLYNMSTCRDLLFHVQEKCYSLEEIEQLLNDLGLIFIGFDSILSQKTEYSKIYPNDPNMANLKNWADFERSKPNIFASMYRLIVMKKS